VQVSLSEDGQALHENLPGHLSSGRRGLAKILFHTHSDGFQLLYLGGGALYNFLGLVPTDLDGYIYILVLYTPRTVLRPLLFSMGKVSTAALIRHVTEHERASGEYTQFR